jgi:hypothetical protein
MRGRLQTARAGTLRDLAIRLQLTADTTEHPYLDGQRPYQNRAEARPERRECALGRATHAAVNSSGPATPRHAASLPSLIARSTPPGAGPGRGLPGEDPHPSSSPQRGTRCRHGLAQPCQRRSHAYPVRRAGPPKALPAAPPQGPRDPATGTRHDGMIAARQERSRPRSAQRSRLVTGGCRPSRLAARCLR